MKIAARFILPLTVLTVLSAMAQTPNADDQLFAAIKELSAKQAQLTDNQSKIESKVADLAEAIRLARLYMKRGGGPHLPPLPGNIPAQKPPPPPPPK